MSDENQDGGQDSETTVVVNIKMKSVASRTMTNGLDTF